MLTKVGERAITFPVHNVERATEALATSKTRYAVNSLLTVVEEYRKANILACSGYNSNAVNGVDYHPLVASVHLAFSEHRPLVLSPDMIWITIVQGFAQHVKNNAEKLRCKFVAHAGRIPLVCQRNDIFENSPESAWDEAILDLSAQLETQLGPIHGQLMTDFSTTGHIERTACAVSLLDAFQPYFQYVVYCVCGIPEITLEGKPEDWLRLREKIDALRGYEIDWWLPHLDKIADQFHRASTGDIDVAYWQNIYKQKDAYGWHLMNGWILHLIPYMKNHASGSYTVINPLFDGSEDDIAAANACPFAARVTSRDLPGGISMAPFTLAGKDKTTKMQFLGGFLGVEQNSETMALRPKLGWAVRKTPAADSSIEETLAGHSTRPPLPYDQTDSLICKLVSVRGFHCMPAEFISFYKACDGLDFPASSPGRAAVSPASILSCTIRSLHDVEPTPAPDHACSDPRIPSPDEIMVNPEFFLRIGDVSDGSYIAIAMERNPRICHVAPAQKSWGVLEDSFTVFLSKLIDNNGRLYKDCLS